MPLNLTGVSYTYDRVQPAVAALSCADVEVGSGELVLVLGTTGSGKSTLLRVAGGLLSPTAGTVLIDERPLDRTDVGGEVGLVFQDAEAQLFADTILEDVAFGPSNKGLSKSAAHDRAREALRSVGLEPDEFGGRSPFSLSGGEARRAAIAGVIAMRPRYLLADEPTAGLDAGGRSSIRSLLLDSRSRGGVMVVSHSADEFLADADRVLILRDGGVEWWGRATELIDDPTPLTHAGLKPPPILDIQARMREITGGRDAFTLDPVAAARSLASGRRRCP
ncbi:MAG: ATP-binding cassette domain-containing protein [Coriobacteriia bacterium]|nr:ATP-binding cassette domain-containing protein [Coriobacteriia bacterium]